MFCKESSSGTLSWNVYSNISVLNDSFDYLLRTKAPSHGSSPSSVCLGCGVRKKLQTPCAQMTKISEGVSRAWICFAAVSPVVWLLVFFFGSFTPGSAVLGARSPVSQPALVLKRNIGSSYYPRLVNKLGRKYYLLHEWTCLFIEMPPWRMVFVALTPTLC